MRLVPALLVVAQVLAQRAAAVGVAQLQDRLRLDLADALARHLRKRLKPLGPPALPRSATKPSSSMSRL